MVKFLGGLSARERYEPTDLLILVIILKFNRHLFSICARNPDEHGLDTWRAGGNRKNGYLYKSENFALIWGKK